MFNEKIELVCTRSLNTFIYTVLQTGFDTCKIHKKCIQLYQNFPIDSQLKCVKMCTSVVEYP